MMGPFIFQKIVRMTFFTECWAGNFFLVDLNKTDIFLQENDCFDFVQTYSKKLIFASALDLWCFLFLFFFNEIAWKNVHDKIGSVGKQIQI